MRTRTVARKIKKQVKKETAKQAKLIIKEFEEQKPFLLELFGIIVTQSLNIKEFEETEDFAIAGKSIKATYTKMKNDLGRLHNEIKLRTEDFAKMAVIKNHIVTATRAKILKKFDELCKREKELEKESGEKLPTASELGIPQQWIDFFNNIELVAECMKDYINSSTFTEKEKQYMRRFITYSQKYIELIEKEI